MNDQPGGGMVLNFETSLVRLSATFCRVWVLRTGQTYHYTIYPQVRASVEYPKIPQVTARPCDDLVGRVSNEKWLFSEGSFSEGVSFIAECLNPMKSH